jgi:hypothetical protein
VPIEDRGALGKAVRARFLAEWQVRYTQNAIREAKSAVTVAKNDVKKVKLQSKSLRLEKKHATKNAQTKQANLATEQTRRNQLELEACRARVAEAKQRVKYLGARLKAERHALRASEARIEMNKAQSMAAAGVKPPGFDLGKYKAQHQQRKAQIQSQLAVAKREKQTLAGLELKAKKCRMAADAKPVGMPETVPDQSETKPPPTLEQEPPKADEPDPGPPEPEEKKNVERKPKTDEPESAKSPLPEAEEESAEDPEEEEQP